MNKMFSYLAILGALGIFLLIVFIAYLPNRPPSLTTSLSNQRLIKLKEVQAQQKSRINSYQWIDRSKGIVQIPVERAIELTIQTYGETSSTIGSYQEPPAAQ